MNELNPEHYKYMPQQEVPQQEVPQPEVPKPEIPASPAMAESAVGADPMEARSQTLEEPEPDYIEVVKQPEWFDFLPVRVLYFLLGPFLAPTIAAWWIFSFSLLKVVVPGAALPYSLTVFGATCIIPAMVVFVLLKIGSIRSVSFLAAKDRTPLYVVMIVAFAALTLFFVNRGASAWLWTIFCGGAVLSAVNFVINYFIRISNHCSAMAALLAVLVVINSASVAVAPLMWWMLATVLAAGFVGSMGMSYGRHSLLEILAGYATGFLSILLISLIR